MDIEIYTITHKNNTLEVFSKNEKLYSSKWFMDFGKYGSEVFDKNEHLFYTITKKFQFWKWRMVYTIKNKEGRSHQLISQNNRKTIFSLNVDEVIYDLKIHYRKKISIFKNNHKIAEFDESFTDENYPERIKLFLLDKKDVRVSFLLFSCLKVGEIESNKKTILTSQKQLETNDEPWH